MEKEVDRLGRPSGARAAFALGAGFVGTVIFLLFQLLFVALDLRYGVNTLLQVAVYVGTPVTEVVGVAIAIYAGKPRGRVMLRNLLAAVWCANAVNLTLYFLHFFGI